jgi:serine O-acetyltransferase
MTLSEYLDRDWQRLAEALGQPGAKRRWTSAFSPRFAPVFLVRVSRALELAGWPRLGRLAALVLFVVFGVEYSPKIPIGPGLMLPHTQGTVIGAQRIGENVTLYQQVTLGAKFADYIFDPATRPILEDGVLLTAGVKVLGPVTIGAGSIVGANAVVVSDIPPGSIAGGIPARVLKRVEDGQGARADEAADEAAGGAG